MTPPILKAPKLVITSDGTPEGTHAFLDGRSIPGLLGIYIEPIEIGQPVRATITVQNPILAIEAQEVTVRP